MELEPLSNRKACRTIHGYSRLNCVFYVLHSYLVWFNLEESSALTKCLRKNLHLRVMAKVFYTVLSRLEQTHILETVLFYFCETALGIIGSEGSRMTEHGTSKIAKLELLHDLVIIMKKWYV